MKYVLYVSIALNGIALQFLWLYCVPPWIKQGFLPAEHAQDFFDDEEGGEGGGGNNEDLTSLGSVYEYLDKVLFDDIVGGHEKLFITSDDNNIKYAVGGEIPTSRLQLALATYIVKINQDFGLYQNYWQKNQTDSSSSSSSSSSTGEEDDEEEGSSTESGGKQQPTLLLAPANITELVELRERVYLTDWAYLESSQELQHNLQSKGYILLRHNNNIGKGQGKDLVVGHYLAFHPIIKEFIICIIQEAGTTKSMGDLLTQLMAGESKDFDLPNNPFTGEDNTTTTFKINAHVGMMDSAMTVLEEIRPILEEFVLPASDYKIVVQGHSIGGGTATLLGMALRAHYPEHRERVQVYAIAPPAILNETNSIQSASFVTSLLNRADCIPRLSSKENLQILMRILINVDNKLNEITPTDTNANDPKTMKRIIDKLLHRGRAPYFATPQEFFDDMIMNGIYYHDHNKKQKKQQQKVVETNNDDDTNHTTMWVPGRIVVLYEKEKDYTYTATGSFVSDGSNIKVKFIQVERTLFTDHMRSSYIQSLEEAIADQQQQQQDTSSSSDQHQHQHYHYRKTNKRLLFSTMTGGKRRRGIRGRIWNFLITKFHSIEDELFTPTTRLDSPFAALVIAACLFWKMIMASLNSNSSSSSSHNNNHGNGSSGNGKSKFQNNNHKRNKKPKRY